MRRMGLLSHRNDCDLACACRTWLASTMKISWLFTSEKFLDHTSGAASQGIRGEHVAEAFSASVPGSWQRSRFAGARRQP